jgi:GntR family transcriptional regulator / MocR family aminotransferase
MRLLYRQQRDVLVGELQRRLGDAAMVDVPDQGMHLVAYLADGLSDVALAQAARERGVIVRAISRFYRQSPPRSGLMLGFSGFPRQLIVPAAARLAQLVKKERGRSP